MGPDTGQNQITRGPKNGGRSWPIVELIGATTTKAGLKVECALDERTYEKGIKISAAQMATLDIAGDDFHPEWNYTIRPRRPPDAQRLFCDLS